ncbi:uncharacterized protein LOC131207814 [Anopheles bellator]|uniref:uncharacterized protein LOC131207814 n=1 Tax=Anopheles bellator TaxID=139047 RepID=UPI0026474364|nr:uncharacterized protein LOC131207814 [Anopheles bellator]
MGTKTGTLIAALLVPLLVGLGDASPDLGLDISIQFVTSDNPNIQQAANVVNSVTSDLNGAIGGFQIPQNAGSTNLTTSATALVTLVSSITGTVNNVLRNISTIAGQKQTAPSCMFASLNATIDKAFAFIDGASALITQINASTSASTGVTLAAIVSLIQQGLQQITAQLDPLYTGVATIVQSGTVSASSVAANISPAVTIQLSGAISVMTTAEGALNTVVRSIRTSFERASSVLNSYSNDLQNAVTSVNNTESDYYNQVVSRINSFKGKVTSDSSSGVSDISGTTSQLSQFIQNTVTRTNAQALLTSINSLTTSVQSVYSAYSTAVQNQLTLAYTAVVVFVQKSVNDLVTVFNANANALASTMSSGGGNASNCNNIYGGTILNLDNNMKDQLNRCINDYANTGYTDSFVSDYNQVIREQTRTLASRINFCLGLGSSSSNNIINAGISACFGETVNMINVILVDMTNQIALVKAFISLEGLAMVQRVEVCSATLKAGLTAEASKLNDLLTTCQTTNQ